MKPDKPSNIRLLAVDVDGTLVRDGKVLPEDAAALKRAAEAGLWVCLCTGRSWKETRPVWERLDLPAPHAPVVCVGGALVAEPQTGRTLYSRSFARDLADELAQDMHARGYPVMLLVDAWREGFDYYVVGSWQERPLYRRFYGQQEACIRAVGRMDRSCARPLRISLLEEPAAARGLVDSFGRQFAGRIEIQSIFAPNYGVHIVEAFAARANKYTGLLYVGQGYDIAPKAMAAIGDDANDLAMLRGAGFSAAPADAPEEVRQAAHLTVGPRGQPIVDEFVRAMLD